MRSMLSACLILGGLTAGSASAQTESLASPTGRIRVTQTGLNTGPMIGTAVSMNAETLQLVPAGRSDTVAIAMASIRGIEESAGHRSRVGRGAVIGGLIGLVVGVGAAVAIEGTENWGAAPITGRAAFVRATVGGTLIGAGIGAMSGGERWIPHRGAPRDVTLIGAPRGATGAGLRVAL